MNAKNLVEATERFVNPKPRTELKGESGLDLHEIALSLGAKFSHVKDRYQQLVQLGEISGAATAAANESNGLDVESYALSVDDAKFLVTQYGNAVGRAYCRWLITQEKQYATVQENLTDPQMARKFGLALIERADAQEALARTQAVVVHMDKSLTTSQSRNGSITREKNQLVQQVLELKEQVGDAVNYKTVAAMVQANPEVLGGIHASVAGKKLKKLSAELNIPTREIPGTRYQVLAYHTSVWAAFVAANQN